jgi:hypothetical protein
MGLVLILTWSNTGSPTCFYKNGLSLFQNKQISILGFGTGLNAFITFEGTK